MPETTIHEYCYTSSTEYKVCLSRQGRDWPDVHSVAETSAMDLLTKTQFRACVSSKYRLHAATHALRRRLG